MTAAPNAAKPATSQCPQDTRPNRHASLLGLIHQIVAYGRAMVAALQRQNAAAPTVPIAMCFGTFNLALIIARITRGLALADRLRQRLLRTGVMQPPNRDNATPPARPRAPRPPEPPRPPRLTQAEDDAALLRALPTEQEIAAMIRRRPAGAVIVDICRDLGIDTTHPLWRQIRDAIIAYDGSLARMLQAWSDQGMAYLAAIPPDLPAAYMPLTPTQQASLRAWDAMAAGTTGPP